MNRYFLRLALIGNRQSLSRSIGFILGLAAGVALVILLVGVLLGMSERSARDEWIYLPHGVPVADSTVVQSEATLISAVSSVDFDNNAIVRVSVAATSNSRVNVPGIAKPPLPGQYYASPAAQKLLRATPDNQLANRFGIQNVGTIAQSALNNPDSLVVISGETAAKVSQRTGASVVEAYTLHPKQRAILGGDITYQFIIATGIVGVLFPVILFINIVTQVGAVARLEKLATLRLLGATPRQTARIAGLEIGSLSLLGVGLGVVVAILCAPLVARISLANGSFLTEDILLEPWLLACLSLIAVVGATLTAILSVLRTSKVVLGTSRVIKDKQPKVYRTIPLIIGVVVMIISSMISASYNETAVPEAIMAMAFGSFLLIVVGIILAGPWLVKYLTKVLVNRASTPAGLIASKRLASAPIRSFRAISGIVAAVFFISVFSLITSSIQLNKATETPGLLPPDGVLAFLSSQEGYAGSIQQSTDEVASRIEQTPGVASVTVAYERGSNDALVDGPRQNTVISCRDVTNISLKPCDNTADYVDFDAVKYAVSASGDVAPPTEITENISGSILRPYLVIVRTDDKLATIERSKTLLENLPLSSTPPTTRAGLVDSGTGKTIKELSLLAYAGTAFIIIVASVSLVVSTIISFIERRRTFSLLRLTGMPATHLKKVIAYESMIPLLGSVMLTAIIGLVTGYMLLQAISGSREFGAPDLSYYMTIGFAVGVAVGITFVAMGAVRSTTKIEHTRFE